MYECMIQCPPFLFCWICQLFVLFLKVKPFLLCELAFPNFPVRGPVFGLAVRLSPCYTAVDVQRRTLLFLLPTIFVISPTSAHSSQLSLSPNIATTTLLFHLLTTVALLFSGLRSFVALLEAPSLFSLRVATDRPAFFKILNLHFVLLSPCCWAILEGVLPGEEGLADFYVQCAGVFFSAMPDLDTISVSLQQRCKCRQNDMMPS